MNRDELIQIIRDCEGGFMIPADIKIATADRILAALEKEREGEVVLDNNCCLRIPSPTTQPILLTRYGEGLYGKRGQLIFRPTPSDNTKGGK